MKLLVLVPARGGSKGLPGKNLLPVGGVSLVGRAVQIGLAAASAWTERCPGNEALVTVDTDDEAIAAEGRARGAQVPFLREAALAGDTVAMFDNVDAAVRRWEERGFAASAVLLLQPTSPLRSLDDVLDAFAAYDPDVGSVVGVVACEHPPEQTFRVSDAGALVWAFPELLPNRRRQDFPPGFRPSGSIYLVSVACLRAERSFVVPGRTRAVEVPRERAVDIDVQADLDVARYLDARATHGPIG